VTFLCYLTIYQLHNSYSVKVYVYGRSRAYIFVYATTLTKAQVLYCRMWNGEDTIKYSVALWTCINCWGYVASNKIDTFTFIQRSISKEMWKEAVLAYWHRQAEEKYKNLSSNSHYRPGLKSESPYFNTICIRYDSAVLRGGRVAWLW
jgi:hypothetical protein